MAVAKVKNTRGENWLIMKRRLTEKTDNGYIIPAENLSRWEISKSREGKVNSFSGDFADRLSEYEDAEENKTLLHIPVPVGEKVWYINGSFVIEYEVTGYSVDNTGAWLMYVEHHSDETDETYGYNFETEKIGKTVFLSKEEAEKKAEEIRNIYRQESVPTQDVCISDNLS